MNRLLLLLLLLGLASPCFGEARYAGKKEMIAEAEAIVVATITKVEKTEHQGGAWVYGQRARATVEQTLKGDATGEIIILGEENFICAQCRYEQGRFLLFLRRDAGAWVGSNWHLGIRPITNDQVQWFKDDADSFAMKEMPLKDAIAEIKAAVQQPKEPIPSKPPGAAGK